MPAFETPGVAAFAGHASPSPEAAWPPRARALAGLRVASRLLKRGPMRILPVFLALAACSTAAEVELTLVKGDGADGKSDASAIAVMVDLELEGELLVQSSWNAEQNVRDQLLYTVGALNGRNAVGRLERLHLEVTDIEAAGDMRRIVYRARLPVVWGRPGDVPEEIVLRLPRDDAREQFFARYGRTCNDGQPGDAGSLWYHYRPDAPGCRLADSDVTAVRGRVLPSEVQTTGRFPEVDRIWQDRALNVVAVFGKFEDGATANDPGIRAYADFVGAATAELARHGTVTTTLATADELELSATTPDGRTLKVNAILTDDFADAVADWDFARRWRDLSGPADLILYNGHAGFGANVRTLAESGGWVPGQYAIVFINGCDTIAYLDDALFSAHAAANPGDPDGRQHVDVVVNAMPAFFDGMAASSMALVSALAGEPLTYEEIFRRIDPRQVVMVTGEEDNLYTPGGEGPPEAWRRLDVRATLASGAERRFETPILAPGRYRFTLSGDGDADLFAAIGRAPTTRVFDCRPSVAGSGEVCLMELGRPARIHLMVRGDAARSRVRLVGYGE